MALTALVKEELAQYEASKASVRKAEVSTILRFTGALHIVAGRIVIESEVDTEQTAQRMQQTIAEIYGHESELTSVTGGGLRRGGRYIVRVDSGERHWPGRPGCWICGAGRCVVYPPLW